MTLGDGAIFCCMPQTLHDYRQLSGLAVRIKKPREFLCKVGSSEAVGSPGFPDTSRATLLSTWTSGHRWGNSGIEELNISLGFLREGTSMEPVPYLALVALLCWVS